MDSNNFNREELKAYLKGGIKAFVRKLDNIKNKEGKDFEFITQVDKSWSNDNKDRHILDIGYIEVVENVRIYFTLLLNDNIELFFQFKTIDKNNEYTDTNIMSVVKIMNLNKAVWRRQEIERILRKHKIPFLLGEGNK